MSANLLIIIVAVGFLVLLGLAVRDFIRTIFYGDKEWWMRKRSTAVINVYIQLHYDWKW